MKKLNFFLMLLCLLVSCTQKNIPLNKMKVIVWDMACADELYIEKMQKDSSLIKQKENIRLYEQVFLVHKISKDEFYSSYKFYQEHADQYKILIDSVQAYGTRQRNVPVDTILKPSSLN